MNKRIGFYISVLGAFFFTVTGLAPTAYAQPGQSAPFEQLQQQIDGLQVQVQGLVEQIIQNGGGQMVTVDCPEDSIGDALAQAKPGRALVLTVTGTCTENVTIARDDVTVQGGGQVVGQITVDGAQRVTISGVTVTGPGNGIEARANAAIIVRNATIENNEISGIDVRQGAFALIDGNVIRFNTECEILVRDSGHTRVLNNMIEASLPKPSRCNALAGAFRNSRIRMVGGNTINSMHPSNFAVDVEHGSTFRQDQGHDTVTGNARVVNTANADFRDVNFTGNMLVVENSNFRTRNSLLTGNVTIGSRSLAVFNASTTVDGLVFCQGSGTVGMGPPVPLTLVDSQGGAVSTSAAGVGWVFRGAVFGGPTFVPPGGFNGCN